MPVLTAEQVEEIRHRVGKLLKDLGVTTSMTKSDWRAAVTALDAYLEANKVAINNQFPEPFKSGASTKEKLMVLSYVALKRFEID